MCNFFFFFEAEGGIRDRDVSGVQRCALRFCGVGGDGTEGKAEVNHVTVCVGDEDGDGYFFVFGVFAILILGWGWYGL